MTVITYRTTGTDDGFWRDSTYFNSDGAYLSIGNVSTTLTHGFAHFPVVEIPKGATINSAKLTLKARSNYSNAAAFRVYAVAADDPPQPAGAAELINATFQTDGVPWVPADWTANSEYETPDLAAIVEALVNRNGWASGQAMLLVIKDDGSADGAERRVHAAEEANNQPTGVLLTVDYTEAPSGPQQVDVPRQRTKIRTVADGQRGDPIVIVQAGASDPVEVVDPADKRGRPVKTSQGLVVGGTYRVRFGK